MKEVIGRLEYELQGQKARRIALSKELKGLEKRQKQERTDMASATANNERLIAELEEAVAKLKGGTE